MSVADRLAIADLFTRYCGALDTGEVETVVSCFSEDAALESPAIGRIAGRSAIRDFATRFAALRAGGAQFRHFVSNIAITLDGDRARATAYLLVVISKDGSHRTLPPGRYDCDLIKDTGGEWRFTRRVVTHDHDYRLDGV